MENRIVSWAFGLCFALALFAAAHSQTISPPPPSAGGAPGGSNTQVQFNNNGAFAGNAGLVWNNTNNLLTVSGAADNAPQLTIGGATFKTGYSGSGWNAGVQIGRDD